MLPGAQRYGAGRRVVRVWARCVPGRPRFMWPLRLLEVGLMRRVRMLTAVAVAGLGSVLLTGAGPAVAGVPSAGAGGWDKAIEVPGTAALNTGGNAEVSSVSCAAAGGCAAGGDYFDGSGRRQAFVVTEAGGRWRRAIEVPGTAALNTGGNAEVNSVSCAAAGSCAAGGFYTDGSGHRQAFVVSEAGGRWGTAIDVPGTAALNTGFATISSVSCAAAGSCAAGGDYFDGSGGQQAFVVTEANGRWRTAIEVPGTAALNTGGDAGVESVSCAPRHGCAAGGFYADVGGNLQAFVLTEAGGRWRRAIEVPGTAALNTGGNADVVSVSCAAGSCAAGGLYRDFGGNLQAFVVTEANGRWRKAIEVPGTAALNKDGEAEVLSVSCAAAGSCTAGGFYEDGSGHFQA